MWTENLNLFLIAVEKGRVDFLEMFKDMLDQTVAYIGHYEKRTLLSLVLEKRDVKSLGIVLSAWTHTLNKPSADYLGQGRYHPSFLFPKKVCTYTLYTCISLFMYVNTCIYVYAHLAFIPPFFNTTPLSLICPIILPYIRQDLLKLSSEFPGEFIQFICSLQMQKGSIINDDHIPYYNLNSGNERNYFGEERRILFRGCEPQNTYTIWSDIFVKENKTTNDGDVEIKSDKTLVKSSATIGTPTGGMSQTVIPFYLPLLHTADVDILKIFVDLGDVSLFDCDIGIYSLEYAWEKFGLHLHLVESAKYTAFLALFTIAMYSYKTLLHSTTAGASVINYIIQISIIIICVSYIFRTLRHVYHKRPEVIDMLEDLLHVWTFIDLGALSLPIIGVLCRLAANDETVDSRSILAVASIFVWFKLLYYLRAFSFSGPLITMIVNIAYDVRIFLHYM